MAENENTQRRAILGLDFVTLTRWLAGWLARWLAQWLARFQASWLAV